MLVIEAQFEFFDAVDGTKCGVKGEQEKGDVFLFAELHRAGAGYIGDQAEKGILKGRKEFEVFFSAPGLAIDGVSNGCLHGGKIGSFEGVISILMGTIFFHINELKISDLFLHPSLKETLGMFFWI